MKKNSQPGAGIKGAKKKGPEALAVLLLTLTLSPKARSDVNTREGNFKYAWHDSLVDRSYSSRSEHRGIFGFRWCSSFDQVIAKLPSDLPNEKCEGQKVGPAGSIERLSADLYQLRRGNEMFLVTIDPQTRLATKIENGKGDTVRYRYEHDELVEVKDGSSKETYRYDLSHNLTDVSDNDSRPQPTGAQGSLHVEYDLVYDRVTDVDYGDGCKDHFTYNKSAYGRQKEKEQTTITRTCHGLEKFSNTYEFTEQREPGSTAFRLIKFRLFNPLGTQTEVSYE